MLYFRFKGFLDFFDMDIHFNIKSFKKNYLKLFF